MGGLTVVDPALGQVTLVHMVEGRAAESVVREALLVPGEWPEDKMGHGITMGVAVGQVTPKSGEEAIFALLVRVAHEVHRILLSPTPFVSLSAVGRKDPHLLWRL